LKRFLARLSSAAFTARIQPLVADQEEHQALAGWRVTFRALWVIPPLAAAAYVATEITPLPWAAAWIVVGFTAVAVLLLSVGLDVGLRLWGRKAIRQAREVPRMPVAPEEGRCPNCGDEVDLRDRSAAPCPSCGIELVLGGAAGDQRLHQAQQEAWSQELARMGTEWVEEELGVRAGRRAIAVALVALLGCVAWARQTIVEERESQRGALERDYRIRAMTRAHHFSKALEQLVVALERAEVNPKEGPAVQSAWASLVCPEAPDWFRYLLRTAKGRAFYREKLEATRNTPWVLSRGNAGFALRDRGCAHLVADCQRAACCLGPQIYIPCREAE